MTKPFRRCRLHCVKGKTWWASGNGNCFWRSLSLSIWRSQRFYRQVKLVARAYASEKSEALVNKGRHLHNITYYDASVVQTFVGTETATLHECVGPGGSRRAWRLHCIVKFIHHVD